jgi:predicted negative regulator of RcsB-dependent stress response
LTRHELKEQLQHDTFTESVSRTLVYASTHRQRLIQWGIVVVIAAVVIAGAFFINSHRRALREQDLQAAFAVLDAQVGPPSEYGKTFPAQNAKLQASIKALAQVAAKDAGTREGFFARYYLGTLKAQNNDLKGAEADLSTVAKSGSDSAALAKIALAQLYLSSKRTSEAQELLRSLVNKPTDLVSKAQAEVLLAQLDASVHPQQAKQIIQKLKSSSTDPAVGRAADELSAQLAK